jgi:hypothetical protein
MLVASTIAFPADVGQLKITDFKSVLFKILTMRALQENNLYLSYPSDWSHPTDL